MPSYLRSAVTACLGLFVGLCVPASSAQTVSVVETTGDQSKLLQAQPNMNFGSGNSSSFVIAVDPTTRYQTMDGFGASLTDSSAWLIWNKLSPSQQSSVMQDLFSPSSGIGLTFLRQPMGSSDLSASGDYSYDDVPAGQTDPNLTNFSIAHDQTYIIPLLKQALSNNPSLKVMALPWSPPAWMKTSGTMDGGNVNTSDFVPLANYFVKFIQAYQSNGIPIYAIAPQNEPLNSNTSYATAFLSAADETTFIASHLGPAFSAAGLTTKIFGYEHNWDNTTYPETILGNSTAFGYVAGSSFHCYNGSVSAQTTVKNAFPSKDIWFTECTGIVSQSFSSSLVSQSSGLMIGATRNWARSVILWALAMDQNAGPHHGGCGVCRGVVTINDSTSPSTVTRNVEYYVLGHLTKFVVPGAVRINSNSFGSGSIEDVAFQNPDGSVALFVLNGGTSANTFTVGWQGSNFNYTLPAGAVATFKWSDCTAPTPPTGLGATAVSTSQINLSWGASTSSCSVTYNVFRSTTSGFTPSSSNQIASGLGGTSFSDTALTGATTYFYLVEGGNAGGNSPPSNQASATTQTVTSIQINAGGPAVSPFLADEDFTGGTTINHANTIDLSGVTNPAPMAVYQTARVTSTIGAGTTFSYSIPGFATGSSHLVRLHFAETFHTAAGQRVFNVSINGTQVLANFDIFAAAGAMNKAVIKEFTAASAGGQYAITFTTVTDKALISGIEIVPIAICTAPNAPSGLTASAASGSQINLSWTGSATPAGCAPVTYSVFRSTTSGFTPSTSNQIASGISTTSFSNTGLACGAAYFYLVEAVDSAGSSGASNQATATTSACPSVQINAGGPAVTPFVADADFSGGATINHANTINLNGQPNPAPAAVYQTARVTATIGAGTTFSYTIPGFAAGSSHTVRLHFCETFWTAAGQRVFNVSINGTQVLSNFDVFATAGGQNRALIESFTASADGSGQFVILFTTVNDKALVSGIEVQ